ncbi:DUF4149 domain-containing protein [Plectonema cf. radiosum LEGE 06105]|uniref:DUF4149 domain-containing protein n=1 Tax=Plectonema cf. radiosum LEGE 06105 TaxID=945769 RepID=A0A8J7F3V1_9CYAN|nr:DUF4149 domain-containing protein [Plectonema radiosum]MBE9211854.1 DUF4149 domain-containing protein [Plectonema cf. radiosum LEGE 06105]
MNTISTSSIEFKRPAWQNIVIITLGFWLSASLLLDWVIMPSLYVSGMMTQSSFATAGYTIFWNFNRVELLCAGLILTGVLALNKNQLNWQLNGIILATVMLAIALVDTYLLTPQMSAIGLQLNLFQVAEVPANMNLMHGAYWFIETVKLAVGGTLFTWYCKQ